jgi:hypothetical protein
MKCPDCATSTARKRTKKTALGYATFFCRFYQNSGHDGNPQRKWGMPLSKRAKCGENARIEALLSSLLKPPMAAFHFIDIKGVRYVTQM